MNHKNLLIIVSLAFLALCGYVIYSAYQPQQTVIDVSTLSSQNKISDKQTVKEDENKDIEQSDISKEYLKSKYRVLGIFQNPNTPNDIDDYKIVNKVQLVVATDRGEPNDNDSQCGSIYTQANCYFFLEPLYIVDAPKAKYLGKLERQGAFDPKSVVFKTPNLVEFKTADGDAGYGYQITWSLNLETGQFKQLSKKEFNG